MKHPIQALSYFIALVAISTLSGCGKSGTSPSKQKVTTVVAMYPATQILSQNGVSTTFQSTYDSNNNLVKFVSNAFDYELDIDPHNVTQTSSVYSKIGNQTTITGQVINIYEYSGPSFAPVDIYTTVPTHMTVITTTKDYLHNISNTKQGKSWDYKGGTGNTITQMATSDAGGQNIDFTYDANDNFKTISFTNLSGAQAGVVYFTLSVTAVDNHPSPFSAVKGYNAISYPQSFAPDYALAFCKNNPTQIISKQFDPDKRDLEPIEQDDFTYTYNAQGYPTSVTVNITYLGTSPSHVAKNYTYTYK